MRQFDDQHLEIAQRRREPAQLGSSPIEPGCAGAAAQRTQQAANAAQTDAQVVQRFGILRLLQPQQRLVQRRFEPAKLGNNICDESHVPYLERLTLPVWRVVADYALISAPA